MLAESTIYIQLLDETVDVWRPVTATREDKDHYPLPDEQPDGEIWAFPPGSRVHCVRRTVDGTTEFVATSLAETKPQTPKLA